MLDPDYPQGDGQILPKRSVSTFQVISTVFGLLLSDIVVYGIVVPLIGATVGGMCAEYFEIPPKWELVIVVATTLLLMYLFLCFVGETTYWKHLFAFNNFFHGVLQVRDVANVVLMVACLVAITSNVESMMAHDKGVKVTNVSEGALYVFLRTLLEWLDLDPNLLLQFGLDPFKDQSALESDIIEHSAMYMLLWAMLTSAIAKLIYFNTLFTYIRAMEIFIAMNPSFGDDEDFLDLEDRDMSALTIQEKPPPAGRLEHDFAFSVKRAQSDEQ